jgi:hypothetical protein
MREGALALGSGLENLPHYSAPLTFNQMVEAYTMRGLANTGMTMLKETPLVDAHRAAGGKLVDFGGWNMPLHYGSQIQEHHAVRESVGMFDVSHMTVVDVRGRDAKAYLQKLLANDVDKLRSYGKALYSGMLNDDGGVIDDLIVYFLESEYRLVVNCATREKDLEWMAKQAAGFEIEIDERDELAMIALQGPKAEKSLAKVLSGADLASIAVFSSLQFEVTGLFRDHKLAYTKEEADVALTIAFLTPALFRGVFDRFESRELPVGHLEKLLIREFSVPDAFSSRVSKYFIDGAKQCGLLDSDNILRASSADSEESHACDTEDSVTESVTSTEGTPAPEKLSEISQTTETKDVIQEEGKFSVHIKGPGMDSVMQVNEEEDLLIIRAMLKKVEKRLAIQDEPVWGDDD